MKKLLVIIFTLLLLALVFLAALGLSPSLQRALGLLGGEEGEITTPQQGRRDIPYDIPPDVVGKGEEERYLYLPAFYEDGIVRVHDFRTDQGVMAIATTTGGVPQYYQISSTDEETLRYTIQYDETSGFVTISLQSADLKEVRLAAERALVTLLRIGESDACRLRYGVYVPAQINEFYALTNLGMSFCPRAVAL